MYRFLSHFIVDYRRPILAVIAAVFLACLFAVPQLTFEFTPQQLFEATGDADEYREIFAERFGREDNVAVIVVEGEDLIDPEVLAPLRDLTYQLRRLDDIDDAQSLATLALPRSDSLSADPILGRPQIADQANDDALVEGPEVRADDAQRIADYAADEPLIADRLINRREDVAMIGVWIDGDIQESAQLRDVLHQIEQTITLYDFPGGVELDVQGIPALRVTIVDQLWAEQLIFVPLTAAVFFLILVYLFRRPSGVILPLGTVLIALVATAALLVLTDSSFNVVNNVLPTLIFVIGISDSIHMLTRHSEEVAAGRSHDDAVRTMIRHTGAACLLTTSTTAVGFLSLLSADTAILQRFGWQAAGGVMFAYLATLFFLSAALTYLRPVRRGPRNKGPDEAPGLAEELLSKIGRGVLARPWTVLVVGLIVTGSVAVHGAKVNVDTTLLEVISEDHRTHQATKLIQDELGGVLPVEISFESDERDAFKRPEVYRAVDRIQNYAAEQPEVLSTESYVDYLQSARVAVVGDPAERHTLPESIDEIEQLLLVISDAPDTEGGLNDFTTSDFRNARVLLRVSDTGAKAQLELADRLDAEIEDALADIDDVDARLTGDAYVASAALDRFIRDLAGSLLIAIVIIFALMALVFRSLKIGIISLIPNGLPLLVTFGYMGWAGIDLNTTTVIIFAISLGIAVDDSIHFFARFVEELERRETLEEAIIQAYHGAGRAILLTSVLLLIGMAVLMTSDFIPTQQFGLLTGITVATAVVADLLILPAILYLVYSRFPAPAQREEE